MQHSDNHIILLGNIVSKDNQLKYFASGTAILELEIITKRKWRNSQGESQEISHYFGITFVGDLAQSIAKDAKAGQGIYIRANYRQPHSSSGVVNDRIEAQFAKIIDRSTSLHWNQAHVVGQVTEWSSLAQTIAGQDLLTLKIALANSDSAEASVEVKLKGSAAKYTYQQLSDHPGTNISAFIEGSLASQSKKSVSGFNHHYWVDAKTCLIN
ncbi:MAG: single-stranded DNA-binding protein [Gammaproteobacteria bacterium]|nr:single-stranded DNA-binding protein [Gammaproteobacteria bacterium]